MQLKFRKMLIANAIRSYAKKYKVIVSFFGIKNVFLIRKTPEAEESKKPFTK